MSQTQNLLTLTELSVNTGIPRATLKFWCQSGKINASMIGNIWVVEQSEIPFVKKRHEMQKLRK